MNFDGGATVCACACVCACAIAGTAQEKSKASPILGQQLSHLQVKLLRNIEKVATLIWQLDPRPS
jgi:hypothetical protein